MNMPLYAPVLYLPTTMHLWSYFQLMQDIAQFPG